MIVLGGRGGGTWQPGDVHLLIGLLVCSLGVVFFGFVPDLVHSAHLDLGHAWQVSALLFATYHLAVIGSQYLSRCRVIARDAPPFGFLPSWLFFFYPVDLLWLLLMSTYAFAIFLVEAISSKPDA